jgi:hypothetical protein
VSSSTWQFKTTVLPGGRIELVVPGLPAGETATVLVVADARDGRKRRLSEILGGYAGGRLFNTAEDVDAYLKAERDSWEG